MKRKKTTEPKQAAANAVVCLYHTKAECLCIRPVTTREQLIGRLVHQIYLAKIQTLCNPDPSDVDRLNADVDECNRRLVELDARILFGEFTFLFSRKNVIVAGKEANT